MLQDEQLFSYIEPILRADFQATENYKYVQEEPVDIPITVVTSTEEPMELEHILMWQKETNYRIEFQRMPGKHFFTYQYPKEIIDIIIRN